VLVLGLVAQSAPARVVAVLLAAALVAARRLYMSIGIRADPDILIGGWHGERTDVPEQGAIPDQFSIRAVVGEGVSLSLTGDAGPLLIDINEAARLGGGSRRIGGGQSRGGGNKIRFGEDIRAHAPHPGIRPGTASRKASTAIMNSNRRG